LNIQLVNGNDWQPLNETAAATRHDSLTIEFLFIVTPL